MTDIRNSAPFVIVNAFTKDPFGGNPAAIVLLKEELPTETCQKIATNFNQPITTFLIESTSPSDLAANANSRRFNVRWFTVLNEAPLCGHGTLAASGYLFSNPELVPSNVNVLHFQTRTGRVITARRDGSLVGISLEAASVEVPSASEREVIEAAVKNGLQKPDLSIKFVGTGVGPFSYVLMVEIDEKDDLASCKIDHSAFLETGYSTNVITHKVTKPGSDVSFVSRMFAPASGVLEDHVCGTAHCLMTPYWTSKLGKAPSDVLLAQQVSGRGGNLKVVWNDEEKQVVLKGETILTMYGTVIL
ncbi:hypothetical protein C8Q75DRAFT_809515 [Abortiporus biennis]|nr:hypothetical protein C8Q75DRAFT_809515 [Abortiporus biennis]